MHLSKEELDQLPDTMTYGSLVTKSNMDSKDVDILLFKIFNDNKDLMLIRSILGSDSKMIQFLDILAGLTLKIPAHNAIARTINEIEIWRNLQKSEHTNEHIKELSAMYKIPSAKIRSIYEEYEEKFGDSNEKE